MYTVRLLVMRDSYNRHMVAKPLEYRVNTALTMSNVSLVCVIVRFLSVENILDQSNEHCQILTIFKYFNTFTCDHIHSHPHNIDVVTSVKNISSYNLGDFQLHADDVVMGPAVNVRPLFEIKLFKIKTR